MEEYVEFISYVLLSAPDGFPEEDYLTPDEQMDLDKAFAQLETGLVHVEQAVEPETVVELRKLLEKCHQLYRTGEDIKGAHLLQDFESILMRAMRSS